MLVVLSDASVKSENVLDEASYAINKGKRVIPLMVDNCEVPFRLAHFHHINFTKDYNKGLQQLLSTLNVKPTSIETTYVPRDKSQTTGSQALKPKRRLLVPLILSAS